MGRTLVAYYSASGVTAKAAAKLAKAADADLFEIKPEVPYTRSDLNYMNSKSRSSVEMNELSCRPAISSVLDNMGDYDTVFVGFPIWWYREPSIIDTFMEAYDFTGKKVIPFCTSGGSGLGSAGDNIKALAPEAEVVSGKRLTAGLSEDELGEWADSLK